MRTITKEEYAFLCRIESLTKKNFHAAGLSSNATVIPLADEGMGSILFRDDIIGRTNTRRFGTIVAQGEFDDSDGMPVSFTINLDEEGQLFELDLWRVDFGRLIRFPNKSEEVIALAR